MSTENALVTLHPTGEVKITSNFASDEAVEVDTYGGKVHIEWSPQAAVTPLGQLPFFIDFLKTADLFSPWVEDCPLRWDSPNAPGKREVLGTLMLSILAGHHRYAHMSTMRSDGVNPPLLGMAKVASEDSVRRSLKKIDENAGETWMRAHLRRCYEPLLTEPWILDIDTTVKLLYGKQEGAVKGYNPTKPGRPSHAYHTYFAANLRIVLDVEAQPGNQSAASHTRPGLMTFLESLPISSRPAFCRGDCAWGNEGAMNEMEAKGFDYLFKIKQTSGVKKLIAKLSHRGEWEFAGQGWQGVEASLQLQGWTKSRRVIVLRREIKDILVIEKKNRGKTKGKIKKEEKQDPKQELEAIQLAFIDLAEGVEPYEYAVLVTSLPDDVLTIAQHYRDRADCENNFDELKNQWGWAGYTTHDLKRCQTMARAIALVYNWWSLFVRLAIPHKHAEAITSRPLLLHAVGKQTEHGRKRTITLTSMHAKAKDAKRLLTALEAFLRKIRVNAEQLDWAQRWRLILSRIFCWFLKGRLLQAPPLLPAPT